MLAKRPLTEDLVAQVDHVRLVACRPPPVKLGRRGTALTRDRRSGSSPELCASRCDLRLAEVPPSVVVDGRARICPTKPGAQRLRADAELGGEVVRLHDETLWSEPRADAVTVPAAGARSPCFPGGDGTGRQASPNVLAARVQR